MVPKILARARGRMPRRATLQHERLTSLVNSMADGVIALDRRLQVGLRNAAKAVVGNERRASSYSETATKIRGRGWSGGNERQQRRGTQQILCQTSH